MYATHRGLLFVKNEQVCFTTLGHWKWEMYWMLVRIFKNGYVLSEKFTHMTTKYIHIIIGASKWMSGLFLLLLSGICVTVPFQNLTITIVIWDQLVWRKRIRLLRCCSILLTRSTNWATQFLWSTVHTASHFWHPVHFHTAGAFVGFPLKIFRMHSDE